MNVRIAHQAVLSWFRRYGRDLPWRQKLIDQTAVFRPDLTVKEKVETWFDSTQRDPYRILIAELMLQQTQVERVLPKYEFFLNTWPSVHDLANASLADVIIAWQGLGYNRRAKYLHQTSQKVVKEYSGLFPRTEAELLRFPGIGKYTARAILAFAYGDDVGVSDTNIQRVFARAWMGVEQAHVKGSSKEMWELIDQSVPKGSGDPWSQALMDLGATICIAGTPKCVRCPLQAICVANRSAQDSGYESYGTFMEQAKSDQPREKKDRPKFQDTDRYFRGRVLDYLRASPLAMVRSPSLIRQALMEAL